MSVPSVSGTMLDVLALLLQAWEDKIEVHGWLIMKSISRSGPAVYRVLDRLEDAGWITGSWEALPPRQDRPRRRYYRLTASGVEAARRRVGAPVQAPVRLRPEPGLSARVHPAVTA